MTERPPADDSYVLARLRDAVAGGLLTVHYQPLVQFPDGAVVGYEALCRWWDPELGQVPPDRFIRLAETDGDLVTRLGRQVLRISCVKAAGWADDRLGISVNVAAGQLASPEFVQDVTSALDASTLAPARLTLEITETAALASLEVASAQLRTLSEIGVRVALDDFGTGYSSLTMLQRLPVHTVKIDRSFVTRINTEARDAVLVRLVVDAAHSAGAQVCAEGVEQLDQAHQLIAMGCDLGQGWLFGRPTGEPLGCPDSRSSELAQPGTQVAAAMMPWAGSTELVVVSTVEGAIKFASMSTQRMLGWTAQDMIGQQIRDYLDPGAMDDGPVPETVALPAVHRVLHQDGDYRWFESTSRQLLEPDGSVREVLTVSRDITATMAARAAADDVQALFQHAFDEAPAEMAITDLDGHFLRVNRAFADLLGMAAEELQDCTVEDLTHPDDRAADTRNVEQLRRDETAAHDVIKRYVHKSGAPVPCRVRAVLARDHVRPEGYIVAHITPLAPG